MIRCSGIPTNEIQLSQTMLSPLPRIQWCKTVADRWLIRTQILKLKLRELFWLTIRGTNMKCVRDCRPNIVSSWSLSITRMTRRTSSHRLARRNKPSLVSSRAVLLGTMEAGKVVQRDRTWVQQAVSEDKEAVLRVMRATPKDTIEAAAARQRRETREGISLALTNTQTNFGWIRQQICTVLIRPGSPCLQLHRAPRMRFSTFSRYRISRTGARSFNKKSCPKDCRTRARSLTNKRRPERNESERKLSKRWWRYSLIENYDQ